MNLPLSSCFSAKCGAYLNTPACGKTAKSPDFMRLFAMGNHEKPQKTRGRRMGTTKSSSLVGKTRVRAEPHPQRDGSIRQGTRATRGREPSAVFSCHNNFRGSFELRHLRETQGEEILSGGSRADLPAMLRRAAGSDPGLPQRVRLSAAGPAA